MTRARRVTVAKVLAPHKSRFSGMTWARGAPGVQEPARINSRFPGLTRAARRRDASFDGRARDRVQGDLVNVDAAFFFLPIFWSIPA